MGYGRGNGGELELSRQCVDEDFCGKGDIQWEDVDYLREWSHYVRW